MAAWASLSGYLQFKPGGGALNRLKSRKRLWCVLDESRGQLVYHKTEEDARCKPPLGQIELRGAAIILDLDNQNQFIILVDGKETYLTAENHESMMIWLMALQAKRDHFAKYDTREHTDKYLYNDGGDSGGGAHHDLLGDEQRERVWSRFGRPAQIRRHSQVTREGAYPLIPRPPPTHRPFRQRHNSMSSSDASLVREVNGHKQLCTTKSLQATFHGDSNNFIAAQLRRNQLLRHGETFDTGEHCKVLKFPVEKTDRSRSLPPVFEELAPNAMSPYSRQMSVSMEGNELMQRQHRQQDNNYPQSTGSHGNNINFNTCTPSPYVVESSSSGSNVDSDDFYGEDLNLQPKHTLERIDDSSPSADAGRFSSSASTDSAIDKEDNSCQSRRRIHDLEKELISTKCELAKVMNRQSCFQEILKKKDEIILDLDEKLSKLGGGDTGYDSKRRSVQASKEVQERVRILQNQNRFLNEEVRRLARLRSQEQTKIRDMDRAVASLMADIELWKLQYVSLIQSSIRFTGTDTMDDAELSLYGGDRHKNKVRNLLDEARKVNPSLPTYENLAAGEVHVDYYGYKHQFQDQGLLLHYLCQELTQHYLAQASVQEQHQVKWQQYLRENSRCLMKNRKELKELCRLGIPDQFRRQMWRVLIHDKVADMMIEKGPHYYRSLCSMIPDSPLAARNRKQISLDLMRTMPSNVKFSTTGSKGIMDLQDVLLAFCIHNPNVGYCQGMNFLVAMALIFMDAQDAFWTLVAVTERYHSVSYFDHNLLGAQADQSVLCDLLDDLLPDLARHLEAIDIEISTVTLNWFLAIFFDAVPFPTLLRIWDCFLLEGPKVLFRFSLAILKLHEREILRKTETISVMRHLKACARVTYDIEGLVQLAFKGMKPFPRRQDITSKQMVYLNALKEKYRWRELQKLAFAERENLFLSLESEMGNSLTFECSAVSKSGEVWACYGNQTQCTVCVVDCKEGTMVDLPIQFGSRVMSLCSVPDAILFGTLSWSIVCYREANRTFAWEQQLHDAVLSLCMYEDEGECRVFAGLADGTLAVLENMSVDVNFYDVMYILIGQSPVMCVRILDSQLWCACGNTVSVIHASTLDAMDSFTVSTNPYDHILTLQPGPSGVWISVRGSSILELWDPVSLNCKMLYDTRAGRYPNLRKDDEVYFNKARITCILPLDLSVWVGTGEGNLITYDVFTHPGSKTPSETSSFVGSYSDNFSAFLAAKGETEPPTMEAYDPIREAAIKVRQLYMSQSDSDDNLARLSNLTLPPTSYTPISSSNETVVHVTADTSCISTASQDQSAREEESCQDSENKTPKSLSSLAVDDDVEALTPTPSFCSENYHPDSGVDLVNKENVKSEVQVLGGEVNADEVCSEIASDSVKGGKTLVKDKLPVSTLDKTEQKIQDENDLNSMLNDPAASINGVRQFYIGEKEQQALKKIISNGSIPTNPQSSKTGDAEGNDLMSSWLDPKNFQKTPGGRESRVGSEIKSTSSSGISSVTDSLTTPLLSGETVEVRDTSERLTSESGIDMASSDGSVVAQECDTIAEMHSPGISFLPDSSKPDPRESLICSTSSGQMEINNKGSSESNARGSVPKKPVNMASVSSSFASSVESRHSESDEVFQDACEALSPVPKEASSETLAATTTEESQYETGQEDGNAREDNPGSMSKETESLGGSQGNGTDDPKTVKKKKRPQSLFIHKNNRSAGGWGFTDGGRIPAATPVDKKLDRSFSGHSSKSLLTETISLNGVKRGCNSNDISEPARPRASSTSSVSTTYNVLPTDPEAQYRLDYTNLHIDTDRDSIGTDASPGSRRSSMFSDSQFGQCSSKDSNSPHKLSYLKNEDSANSADLKALDCDPSNFIFPQDYYSAEDSSTGFHANVVGKELKEAHISHMFHTPAISTLSCHTWSSYDEVSTPSRAECDSLLSGRVGRSGGGGTLGRVGHLPRNSSMLSTNTSIASTAELVYAADLTLMSKNKISDKPVKCLLLCQSEGKPAILSFSGSHSDDEAVLKWTRMKDEMLWTNDPILEYNPATKQTKLPTYMQARLSSSSSTHSVK